MSDHLSENEVVNVGPDNHTRLPDLMGILQRRKAYLVLGGMIGLILGLLYYAMATRRYESIAQILVLKKQTENPIQSATNPLPGSSASATTPDFLETHRAVIRSPLIVGRAIEKGNLQQLETFRGEDRLLDTIIKSMKVEREIDKKAAARFNSQVLNVSFQGIVPEECSVVVNAILDSYQDFLNDSSRGSVKETLDLIKKARDLIQRDMDEKEKAYANFRQNTPVLWKGPTGATLYQERLGNIDAQRSALMRQEADMEATLAAVDAAQKNGGSAMAMQIISGLPATREMPVSAPTLQRGREEPNPSTSVGANTLRGTLEDELLRLQLEEGKLLEVFGPQHPEVLSVRDRIRTVQALMVPANIDPSKPSPDSERERRTVQRTVDTKIGLMKSQLREIKRSQQAFAELFRKELEEAKKVFPYETQDDSFKRSLDRSAFLYESIMKRMEDLDIVSNVGAYDSQVITPPQTGEKVSPKGTLVFPIALFLGLLGGFGLAYLAEVTDKSFHAPEEIRARLGLPLIGHIPVLKQDEQLLEKIASEGGLLHPVICSYYRPKSRDAEAYRGVRTALYFSTRGGGYKTIQITSPDMGDGKSTLAANLAVAVANSGKKVILIDADFRRPQQDKLFGLSNKVGFASVLNGSAELAEALRPTVVPGLSILTSGAIPPNPAELLTSPRFKELLDVLSEQSDLVLIDTPPLLAVSDPSVVAPRVDGVILGIRLRKQSRVHAEQAREILGALGAHVLGVVVNAVNSKKAGRYGYGYGGYGADENARYYQEETPETSNGKV